MVCVLSIERSTSPATPSGHKAARIKARSMVHVGLSSFAIDDQIGNLYIPGRETRASATAQRYLSSLALAPVDNYITEFLPDIAKRIHVRVVFIQQIINQVANRGTITNNQ